MSLCCDNCGRGLSYGFSHDGGFLAFPEVIGKFPLIGTKGSVIRKTMNIRMTGSWRSICPSCIVAMGKLHWYRSGNEEKIQKVYQELGLNPNKDVIPHPVTIVDLCHQDFLISLMDSMTSTNNWTFAGSGYPEVIRGILALAEWLSNIGDNITWRIPYHYPGQLIPPGEPLEILREMQQTFNKQLEQLKILNGRCMLCAEQISEQDVFFIIIAIDQISSWLNQARIPVDKDICCQNQGAYDQLIRHDSPEGLALEKTKSIAIHAPEVSRIRFNLCVGCYVKALPRSYQRFLEEKKQ